MIRSAQQVRAPRPRRGRGAARQTFVRVTQGVASVLGAVALLAGVYYGTRLESVQVTKVVVIGGETIVHEKIEEIVNEELSGTYGGLIPHRFFSMYPRDEILARVHEIPRLKDARVFLPDRHTLRVEFSEYVPAALWCPEPETASAASSTATHVEQVSQDPCFFIDASGYAFAESVPMRGALYVRFTHASTTPAYGTTFVPGSLISEMLTLRMHMRNEWSRLNIVGVDVVGDDDVVLRTSSGAVMRIRGDSTARDVYDTLVRIFETDTYKYLLHDGFKSIDLRFGNRVYVRDTRAIEAANTVATSTEVVR